MLFAYNTRTATQPKAAIAATKTALGTACKPSQSSEASAATPCLALTRQASSTLSEPPAPSESSQAPSRSSSLSIPPVAPKVGLNNERIKDPSKNLDGSQPVRQGTTDKHSAPTRHFVDPQGQHPVAEFNDDDDTIGQQDHATPPCSKPKPAPMASVYDFCECRLILGAGDTELTHQDYFGFLGGRGPRCFALVMTSVFHAAC